MCRFWKFPIGKCAKNALQHGINYVEIFKYHGISDFLPIEH